MSTDFEDQILVRVSPELKEDAIRLCGLLQKLVENEISPEAFANIVRVDSNFRTIFELVKDARIVTKDSILSFGDGNQMGDIVIRDVINGNIFNVYVTNSKTPATETVMPRVRITSDRNRSRMLQKVRTFWINGVLEDSLHKATFIELGLEFKMDAISYPWNMQLGRPDTPIASVPSGTKILDIYEKYGGELLILGQPGSGKTTLLLDLAKALLSRAERDKDAPMPVILNLSSWATKRLSITDWIINELHFQYQVPIQVGDSWLKGLDFVFLLDGLDEVIARERSSCIAAINSFRQENMSPIVVCSRTMDYQEAISKLQLQCCVLITPLSRSQISEYLSVGGEKSLGILQAIQLDDVLLEMASSPLMLNILMLAYCDENIQTIPISLELDKQKHLLFSKYIRQMLFRKGRAVEYSFATTMYSVKWFARYLKVRNQTTLFLDKLQKDCLPNTIQAQYIVTLKILIGLTFALSASILFGSLISTKLAIGGVIFAFIVYFEKLTPAKVGMLSFVLIYTVIFIESMVKSWDLGWYIWLNTGVMFGFIDAASIAFASWIVSRTINISEIKPIENVTLSWKSFVLWFLCYTIITSLPIGLLVDLLTRPIGFEFLGVAFGVAFGVGIGLLGGLIKSINSVEIERKSTPNQGIWRSFRIAGVLGIGFGLVSGAIAWMLPWLTSLLLLQKDERSFLEPSLQSTISIGFSIGLTLWLAFGGIPVIQHVVLRFFMWKEKILPWNALVFFEYCKNCIILRQVGGGYVFIHRLLLEFLAEEETIDL